MSHWLTLRAVRVQQRITGLALQHQRELPRQVVAVLNARIATQAVGRRMAVCGITGEEDAALAIVRSDHMIDLPRADALDLHLDARVADRLIDKLQYSRLGRIGRQILPLQEQRIPFGPRLHAGPYPEPRLVAGQADDEECAGAVCGVAGEISFEPHR
jgi:hypothetical protein